MEEKVAEEAVKHSGWLVPILIGAVQALLILLYRGLGVRIGSIEDNIKDNMVPRKEYEALEEGLHGDVRETRKDVKKLLSREHHSRSNDA